MTALPVIALRLLDGRVGSTLLMQLLGTSSEVAMEREYPAGERRYLSYCLRVANWVGSPWNPAEQPDSADFFFGPPDRGGPIPFSPSLLDIDRLGPPLLHGMWDAVSEELRRSTPVARYYAEKLIGNAQLLFDSDIPLHLIDLVRDPRDVFCSIRAFTAGGPGFGRKPDQSDEEFLEQMAAHHLHQLRDMANTPSNVQRTFIRYEDLVTDFPTFADKLSKWLGLQLDAAQALAATSGDQRHGTSASAANSIGRWRRQLSPALADRLWRVLGDSLEPLGYSR